MDVCRCSQGKLKMYDMELCGFTVYRKLYRTAYMFMQYRAEIPSSICTITKIRIINCTKLSKVVRCFLMKKGTRWSLLAVNQAPGRITHSGVDVNSSKSLMKNNIISSFYTQTGAQTIMLVQLSDRTASSNLILWSNIHTNAHLSGYVSLANQVFSLCEVLTTAFFVHVHNM